MKNKLYLIIAFAAIIFAGCKTEEPEAQPTAIFSYSTNDLEVTFTNESLNAQSYHWDFGDGSTSSEENPKKIYPSAGTYKVTLKVTNGTLDNSTSTDITVSVAGPIAKFSYSRNNLDVKFNNQSTNADSFLWKFGNGESSTLKDLTITYKSEGTYSVSLTAKRGDLSDTYTQQISVSYSTPKASFTYKIAHPLKVVLTNTSNNASSYQWDFGDGTTSIEKNPTHKYKGIGVYKIKLTAKNGSKTDICETNVTIEAPTICYVTGFTVVQIPNNNYYYQVQLTDDYIMSKTTYFCTTWFLLSSANTPYLYTLSSAKQLNMSQDYVIRLYKRSTKQSNTQASGKGDYSASITSTKLKTYPETITWSETNIGMIISFSWK